MVKDDDAPSRAGTLALVGGDLALDFANTSSGRSGPAPEEHLRRPQHVAQWAARARVLSQEDGQWLAQAVGADSTLGERLIGEALALRDDVYLLCAAVAGGLPTPTDPIERLSRAHVRALAKGRLAPFGKNFGWSWRPREAPVEAVLGPISMSALTLLKQADLTRVKQCQGEKCGWLFFDVTKNKSRRWCEMEVCGNRAKQKRFGNRAKA